MLMVQVKFRKPSSVPNSWFYKEIWVDASHKLQPKMEVTFKGETERWQVVEVYSTAAVPYADLDKKWGLNLPKSQRTER